MMSEDHSTKYEQHEYPPDQSLPRTLRDAFRERVAARERMQLKTDSHDLAEESLGTENVTNIEKQRAKKNELTASHKSESAREVEPANEIAEATPLKKHWEKALREFDRVEQSHETISTQPKVDEVEKLRANLDTRLKQALLGLNLVHSHSHSRQR